MLLLGGEQRRARLPAIDAEDEPGHHPREPQVGEPLVQRGQRRAAQRLRAADERVHDLVSDDVDG
jgi:hypothetical protein